MWSGTSSSSRKKKKKFSEDIKSTLTSKQNEKGPSGLLSTHDSKKPPSVLMQACISAFDGNLNICGEKSQLMLKVKNPQTLCEL